jgi:hypothetical protein
MPTPHRANRPASSRSSASTSAPNHLVAAEQGVRRVSRSAYSCELLWTAAKRSTHPARGDRAIALALFLLPALSAVMLWRHGRFDVGVTAISCEWVVLSPSIPGPPNRFRGPMRWPVLPGQAGRRSERPVSRGSSGSTRPGSRAVAIGPRPAARDQLASVVLAAARNSHLRSLVSVNRGEMEYGAKSMSR